jgi:ABC-2 type transport system ATP-binding protein
VDGVTGLAIEVRGLTKAYGSKAAVDGLDLDVGQGEVFALLGPNGAGKTTTVEILEGYRQRDGGEVRVLGTDPARADVAWRTRVGIVLQGTGEFDELRVEEVVQLFAGYYPDPDDPAQVIERVGLAEKRRALTHTLSGGQKRRLDVALGVIGRPELLFLDEPTTGFDPAARRQSWELISSLRSLGKTILLTTHYMDEAQHLADRVVVIARGRVIAEGTPDSLGRDGHAVVSFRLPGFAEGIPLPESARIDREVVTFETSAPTRELAPLLTWAAGRGMELEGLSVGRPTLEDVYLQLTEETR